MTSSTAINPSVLTDPKAFFRPQTWTDMNASLGVGNAEVMKNLTVFQLDEATGNRLNGQLIQEGYFHVAQMPWNLPLPAMAEAIIRLTQRGLVPPFCFMYDEFWIIFYRLHGLLGRLLGPGYRMLPEFWAWHVDPRAGDSGWKPHRDKDRQAMFPDGRPKSLSVWLPLTQATPLNGCIYVVPAHLDPTYNTPEENRWKFAFQDIRAVPSSPGDLLVWTSEVIHWGSRSSPMASGPRISLAFEFQRGDVPPISNPLLAPLTFLTVSQRLQLICKQVLQYQHMYPLAPEMKALVAALMAHIAADTAATENRHP
jgi:hypothetical protein